MCVLIMFCFLCLFFAFNFHTPVPLSPPAMQHFPSLYNTMVGPMVQQLLVGLGKQLESSSGFCLQHRGTVQYESLLGC